MWEPPGADGMRPPCRGPAGRPHTAGPSAPGVTTEVRAGSTHQPGTGTQELAQRQGERAPPNTPEPYNKKAEEVNSLYVHANLRGGRTRMLRRLLNGGAWVPLGHMFWTPKN